MHDSSRSRQHHCAHFALAAVCLLSVVVQSEGFSGLAYCVGSIPLMPFMSAKPEHFLTALQLNTLGAITALRAAYKPLLLASQSSVPSDSDALPARPSSVLLFSTVAAQLGFANHSVISTAKAAVDGLTRSLAAEWAPYIRVNAIAPTLTRSKIAEPLHRSEALLQAVAATHALRRTAEADDLAGVACLLLGDEGGYVTGQVWSVDGGKSTLLTDGAKAKVAAVRKQK